MPATVAGENVVLFVAGTVGLAGLLLGLIAVVAVRAQRPYAWDLGFAALLLGSIAATGGFWKISGETGLIFLIVALLLVVIVWGGLAVWYRWVKPPADPECEGACECSNNHRSD